jgi:hypothetical protein
MPTDVKKLVESVLAERTAVANKERELIDDLNRVLPDMGYRVVSITAPARPSPGGTKSLPCPHCARTFAHRLHLGRHLSATHGAKIEPKKS